MHFGLQNLDYKSRYGKIEVEGISRPLFDMSFYNAFFFSFLDGKNISKYRHIIANHASKENLDNNSLQPPQAGRIPKAASVNPIYDST